MRELGIMFQKATPIVAVLLNAGRGDLSIDRNMAKVLANGPGAIEEHVYRKNDERTS